MCIGSLYKNGPTQHICMSGCPFIYLFSTKLLREVLEANLFERTNILQLRESVFSFLTKRDIHSKLYLSLCLIKLSQNKSTRIFSRVRKIQIFFFLLYIKKSVFLISRFFYWIFWVILFLLKKKKRDTLIMEDFKSAL